MPRSSAQWILSGLMAAALAGCAEPEAPPPEDATAAPVGTTPEAPAAPPRPAAKQAFFGDLHVHTRYSYDAFVFGTRADPDAAYEFAKGEPITHPAGFEMRLDQPLDFLGVSDHANYLGMLPAMTDADSPAFNHPAAETVRNAQTAEDRRGVFRALQPYVRFIKDSDPALREHLDMNIVRSAWSEIIASANRHNDPHNFTAFIAYEYTSAGAGGVYENLHRNVVFRGADGPEAPFSRLDSYNPEDLWDKMDEWRTAGIDSMAIPHNTNGSGGRMFEFKNFEGTAAIDDAYAARRARNETTVEMTQTKGTSETHPALSPNDEWADFEIMPYRVSTQIESEPPGSYARDALLRGLTIAAGGVANPYKFGFIGASDTHVAAGAFEEDMYWDAAGLTQTEDWRRGSVPLEAAPENNVETVDDGTGRRYLFNPATTYGASGLAAVWAEANTREAIFDAMRRRETFATSGPRIRLRFFGGNLADLDLTADGAAAIAQAYERGVPMGGDLPNAGVATEAPSFFVWALADPSSTPLQRMQIVKGWLDGGEPQERVYDVACADGLAVDEQSHRCPDNGATVDLATCSISADKGAAELDAIWTDPDFDATQPAFYYVRALENTSCRWSTWDAIRAGVAPREDIAATIQERAWSSPIWHTPP